MTEPRLSVVDNPGRGVGKLLAEAARQGVSIVLTGGSTPGQAYEHAAELEPDWSKASVWWSDERCVPPDDERSNYGLAKRTLLDRLEKQPDVHRIRGELNGPARCGRRRVRRGPPRAGHPTYYCSVLARTGTSPRSSPARRS